MQKRCAMPDQTCTSQLNVFCTLIFHHAVAFLLLTHSHGGQAQTTLATVGGDVTLPCHVRPATDAVNQMLEWSRPDLNPRFVHVRRSGEVRLVDQNPSYKGRTSVSIDGLKQGDASLTLSEVRVTDEGTYRCFVPGLETVSNVQLVVVSGTVIEITKVSSGVLDCESRGWYPEPEVLWLDGEGNLLSAGPTETVRGPDDLYTVSSRVTVEKRHSNSFTCRVQQRTINQTRETHITVPDDFFSGSSGSSSSSSASTIIGLVVGFMFILAVAFVVWKWRQNKIRKVEHHVDEETQRGGEKKSNSISDDSEQQFLIERESDNREKLTAERQTNHQEKAGGETYHIVPHIKKDRTEGETRKDLDDTEEETKSINEETPAPPPEQRDTHQEEPEDTHTETAAQSREGIKPAGQGPTDGEKDELEETGGQTGKSDATPCPTEGEGQHEKNTAERESEKDTEEDNNVVINETEPQSSLKTETHTEQPEKSHDSRDGENGMKIINGDIRQTDKPPAGEKKDVENAEEEQKTVKQTENTGLSSGTEGETNEKQTYKQDGEKGELEETGGQTGKSDATPCPTEGEGQHEKNTAEREMMKNSSRSEGTGCSCQNKEETHQEKAGGETRKDLDNTEEETKANEETPAPPPAEKDTHQEEPEDTNTETAAQSREEIKPAGQGPTDGEKDELEETGGQTGKSDATPCPTEGEGQHEKNTAERESEKDTEEDNNVVINETEPQSSLKTETHTEQPEKSHDSRDGENGMKIINGDIRQTDKPPAGEKKDVENAEEEQKTVKQTENTGLSSGTEGETNEKQTYKQDGEKDIKSMKDDIREPDSEESDVKNAEEKGTETEEETEKTGLPCGTGGERNEKQPDNNPSRDGENGRTFIKGDIRETEKPPADKQSDVENTEEENKTEETESTGVPRETNRDAQNRKEEGNQEEKQRVIKKKKKKRSKRSDRNQNVAVGEEEHHPNQRGHDAKY